MNNISTVKNCCGCDACLLSCPKHCISNIQDREGFYKVRVDENQCVDCGLCLRRCPMQNLPAITSKTPDAYAAASQNENFYLKSSSGGIFSEIAHDVLKTGGSVFGCGLDSNLVPTHMEITDEKDLDRIRRSKYVQSYMGGIYETVQNRLKSGVNVLFCGTPCQIAGLRNYLSADYNNLLTIDLICHGVPSPQMYSDNIAYVERKHGKQLKDYQFRLKPPKSYRCYTFTFTFTDGTTEIKPYYKDAFYNAFYDMTSLNECCYDCPFSNMEREGDITIGDYEWGKEHHAEFEQFNEISCVLCNTEKGKEVIRKISDLVLLVPTRIEWITEKNLNLIRPTLRPAYRNLIYKEIDRMGYEEWANHYFHSLRYWKKTPWLYPLVHIKIKINKLQGMRK